MKKSGRETADAEACLIAAEQVQRKLMAIRRKIVRLNDPSVRPNNPLPVDDFLDGMVRRKSAPRIVFKPTRLGGYIWTESVKAYVYAGIERAFVKAGRLPGGNRSGHAKKLAKLRSWAEQQEKAASRLVPKHFVSRTALLFADGILEDRRRVRIDVVSRIGHSEITDMADLAQLKIWIDEDLADSRLCRGGRSLEYQKITFAAEIANLWNSLTGEGITKKEDGNFVRFVTACWDSGFVGIDVNSSFKRTICDHFAEIKIPDAPG